MNFEQSSQVGVVHISGCSADTPATRLSVRGFLGGIEWHPAGIPPSAILIVRRVQDLLSAHEVSNKSILHVRAIWEQGLHQSLLTHYHRAARPAHGFIHSASESVLFRDMGEMLACFLLDMSFNKLHEHWWWRVVLRKWQPGVTSGLEAVILQNIRYFPAALAHLDQWGHITRVIRCLSPRLARCILDTLLRAYGLDSLKLDSTPSRRVDDHDLINPTGGSAEHENLLSSFPGPKSTSRIDRISPAGDDCFRDDEQAWDFLIPAAVNLPSLAKEIACLLVVGLCLHTQPRILKETEFIHSLRRLWKYAGHDSLQRRYMSSKSHDQLSPATSESEAMLPDVTGNVEVGSRKNEDSFGPSAQSPANIQVNRTKLPYIFPDIDHSEQRSEGPRQYSDQPPATQSHHQSLASLTQQEAFMNGVFTQVGGVLYLINLMQQHNLPECFEKDWRLASQVGTWGVLDVIARALLGAHGDCFLDDPIWSALASLEGREPGGLPGVGFLGASTYRLPGTWLAPLIEAHDSWCWSADGKRLRLWSHEGYLLLDRSINKGMTPVEALAIQELQGFLVESGLHKSHARRTMIRKKFQQAPLAKIEGKLTRGLNADLNRWLSMFLPAIRSRLSKMLGLGDNETQELVDVLLLVPGRLYVTQTHVDLVASLDAISLPARLAGMDFDLGWLPDFGRVVKFHFK